MAETDERDVMTEEAVVDRHQVPSASRPGVQVRVRWSAWSQGFASFVCFPHVISASRDKSVDYWRRVVAHVVHLLNGR